MKTLEFYDDDTHRTQVTIDDEGGIQIGYQWKRDGEWWDFHDSGASLSAGELEAVVAAMNTRGDDQ